MYDETVKQSKDSKLDITLTQATLEHLTKECNVNEQQSHEASQLLSRHGSMAELTTIAMNEKELIEKWENSQSQETLITCIDKSRQEQDIFPANHVAAQMEVHSTPTKIASVEKTTCDDPLTPTANLKMLMSVVSPAIRDRDEKKKDLFVNRTFKAEVIDEKPIYSRKDRSLGLLCQRFLALFPENPDGSVEVSLDEVAKDLRVERRRVYDIVNVLESVDVLSRLAKNRYLWHGKSKITQTLGKLKFLSRKSLHQTIQERQKENLQSIVETPGKQKMKRFYSFGDEPSPSRQFNEPALSQEEERAMIKAAIDMMENCRKDKSLGVLSQKFLIMFLLSTGGVVTLEDAATVLLDQHDETNVKYRTKVRRLYDIANILQSLKLIEKVHIRGVTGKKPGFKWIGKDIESLSDSTNTNQNRQVKIGRPPLLQEPSLPCPATFAPRSRWRKSASFGASLVRHSSSQNDLEKDEGGSKGAAEKDGFEVHEFESSGRDMDFCSPTERTFHEDLEKMLEKHPERMSQLLAHVQPQFRPANLSSNINKSSRRKLFNKSKSDAESCTQSNVKRLRTNSDGNFNSFPRNDKEEGCRGAKGEDVHRGALVLTNKENIIAVSSGRNTEIEKKPIYSVNPSFKVMSSVNELPRSHLSKFVPVNLPCDLSDRSNLEHKPKSNCQWQPIDGRFTPHNGHHSPIVRFVDEASSPIPPCKLVPHASIAIQTSLIENISPLKPLVYVNRNVQSPWKPQLTSPIPTPPVPPSTPELPYENNIGPFQSQYTQQYSRRVTSPYPTSASCRSSPMLPLTQGTRYFFPPSPHQPSMNSGPISQASHMYGVVSQPVYQSNSCPPSIKSSPIPFDPKQMKSPGISQLCSMMPTPCTNKLVKNMETQTIKPKARRSISTNMAEIPSPSGHMQAFKRKEQVEADVASNGKTPTSGNEDTAQPKNTPKLCSPKENHGKI
ncbi:uncharacterized protein LOC124438390 isoform X2 [Xenia sp. Carnegie-2017]|uniref:uncharacterized protein LOC124438390 isoform X2 n=1 Tax=Xenia sp. Carnegie-2017 TaxID=2897299 RepID=UPI001F04C5D1|nr:uncharacterized protein LOC124438390 isoform X2 [Xenia sp. Carnegie-2017]